MKLSQYNPSSACDMAQTFELMDPFSGESIKDENGEVMTYTVLGMQSQVAKNEDSRIRREWPQEASEEDVSAFLNNSSMRKMAELVTELGGNWEDNDKPLHASDKKRLARMLGEQEWIANQVASNASNIKAYRPKIIGS